MAIEKGAPSPQDAKTYSPPGMSMEEMLATLAEVPKTSLPFSSASMVDPEQLQSQIVLLLHAYMCIEREKKLSNQNSPWKCTLPHCIAMKDIVKHLKSCQATGNCVVPNCSSARQTLLTVLAHVTANKVY